MSNSIFSKSPFRQGQLVTPFGVGSMSVTNLVLELLLQVWITGTPMMIFFNS